MSSASYRLHALHLYNWGAFAGRHQASISPDNSAIIGPTGSGKTTLIDALMTLLCQHPRYNLASTGGHESDRDLVSYLRGASGPGHEAEGSAHLARQGRCVTGLAAQLRGADDDGAGDIWLGAILWLDGSSSAQADMGRRWFFAQGGGHSLDLWLEEHHSGGARALSRLVKNSDGLEMFSSKSAYLARVQRFFEIGPNAFTLLNRAAGLKQLNSIDEIFRDLVLDDHSAFDDALRVADSFDELAAIHAELELANRQCLALLPLRELAQQEARQQQALQDQRLLHAALPHWCARLGQQQWAARCADLQQQLNAQAQRISAQEQQLEQARQQEQTLLEAYLRAGGGDIELLRRSIATQQDQCRQRAQHWAQFQQLAGQISTYPSPSPLALRNWHSCRPRPRPRWRNCKTRRPRCKRRWKTPWRRSATRTPRWRNCRTKSPPCASGRALICHRTSPSSAPSWPSSCAWRPTPCPSSPSWSKCPPPTRPGAAP